MGAAEVVPINQAAPGNLYDQCVVWARTNAVPKQFYGKPDEMYAAVMLGSEYGFPPMQAMRTFDVINGKPTLTAEACIALVRRAGHSVQGEASGDSCTLKGKRCDNGDEFSVTWTIEDAKRANLNSATWKQYPRAMLFARAASELCRRLFQDVTLGLYVHEELASAEVIQTEDVRPVPIVDAETGEMMNVAQPPAENKLVDVLRDKLDRISEEKRAAATAWLEGLTVNNVNCGYSMDRLEEVPSATLRKLDESCNRALTEDLPDVEDAPVTVDVEKVHAEIVELVATLTPEQYDTFEGWCVANGVSTVWKSLGADDAWSAVSTLREILEAEPWDQISDANIVGESA